MNRRIVLAALATLAMSGSALAALDAHYLGMSRDGAEFRIYLHGGEYLGRHGTAQTVGVTVHQLRRGRPQRTLQGCVYYFDDSDRHRDRIECAPNTPGPLAGVAYVRAPNEAAKDAKDERASEPMVCMRRCGSQVPQRLGLEEADEDNG